MASETTLILFKPDCVQRTTGIVLDRYLKAGFRIRGLKMLEATDELLNEHYAHIASLPFFPDVQSFMKEAPVVALALEGEDVISRVRDILGPTDSNEAAPGTIGGDFGAKDGIPRCAAFATPRTVPTPPRPSSGVSLARVKSSPRVPICLPGP